MTVLALHGFTQRGSTWDEVAAFDGDTWIAPDLPGHGGEPATSWDATVESLGARLHDLERPRVLVGYSMGGRLALGVVLHRPELVDALVVVSATPGIRSVDDRRRRAESDAALGERIRSIGVEAFVDEWIAAPMFSGLAARGRSWLAADRSTRVGSSAEGLAGALVELGQGTMPWLGPRVRHIVAPATFVAGSEDARYAATARRMARAAPRGRVWMVPACGHAVVGEDPRAVAAAVALARRTIG
ncbi:MAG TPA: alpha/beta fold hydrolase [Acidimicrobiia bacterium]|nr:alpha/beta fold hydrolase [Acidimicrobiia bacterium]